MLHNATFEVFKAVEFVVFWVRLKTLKMEAARSSERSVNTNVSEDTILSNNTENHQFYPSQYSIYNHSFTPQ
jgi:hypothetical protein